MKSIAKIRRQSRDTRRKGVRKRVIGSQERPRLCVFRSHKFTYAQLISDESGSVIVADSTQRVSAEENSPKSVESAKLLGQRIAELAKNADIKSIVFDRNGYRYHGRVAAVAEGAREGGLEF